MRFAILLLLCSCMTSSVHGEQSDIGESFVCWATVVCPDEKVITEEICAPGDTPLQELVDDMRERLQAMGCGFVVYPGCGGKDSYEGGLGLSRPCLYD